MIYACYEQNFCNKWILVCYHDSKPPKSANSSDKTRTEYFELTPDLIDIDGSPNFGKLAVAFPRPN